MSRPNIGGVVLAGDRGIGKSRLAAEAVTEAAQRDCATRSVIVTRAAASIPFGPVAPLLTESVSLTSDPLHVMRQAVRALADQAAGRRLVISVDDAHHLDESSAALIHQLAHSGTAFVVLTACRGDPVPEAVTALWKDGLAERLEVQALSRAEVEQLAGIALGGHVDGPTLVGFWRATLGNVLLLRELVLSGLESGSLSQRGGMWSWTGPFSMTPRLAEVLGTHLGTLAPEERALLELLAHGEPIPVDVLEAHFSAECLQAVERRGIVALEQSQRRLQGRLAHPLYGEVLRADTPLLRSRALNRQVADLLASTPLRREDDVLRRARARLESGQTGASEVLLSGARQALAGSHPALAERLARAVVEAGGGVRAHHAVAQALVAQGRATEAHTLLEELESAMTTDAERSSVVALRAVVLCWSLGRPRQAEALLAHHANLDGATADELTALLASVQLSSGRVADALTTATTVLEGAASSDRARIRAAVPAVLGRAIGGNIHDALAAGAVGREAAVRIGRELPLAIDQLLASEAIALCFGGHLEAAGSAASLGYRGALERGAHAASVVWAAVLGEVALARGEVAEALLRLREAAALCRARQGARLLPACLATLARAASQAGDAAAAREALAEAEATLTPALQVIAPQLELARAWTAAAGDQLEVARRAAATAGELAEGSGQHAVALLALHDAVRLGDASDDVRGRLCRLVGAVEGPFATACSQHVQALADADPVGLETASGRFEAMGSMLLAAEAALEESVSLRAQGRAERARAAAGRARRLLHHCSQARTPVLIRCVLPSLTRREHEVARLAASGLPSTLIAQRLNLSVRTVENHLQNVYAKLGVTGRQELGPMMEGP